MRYKIKLSEDNYYVHRMPSVHLVAYGFFGDYGSPFGNVSVSYRETFRNTLLILIHLNEV